MGAIEDGDDTGERNEQARSGRFELDAEFGEGVFDEERVEQGADAGVGGGNDVRAREAGAVGMKINRGDPLAPALDVTNAGRGR